MDFETLVKDVLLNHCNPGDCGLSVPDHTLISYFHQGVMADFQNKNMKVSC